jgi:hypothetical protein
MLRQIRHMAKLARAARVIARHGGLMPPLKTRRSLHLPKPPCA